MATNKTYNTTVPLHDFPGGAANSAGMIESATASCVGGWRSYTGNSATSGSSYGGRFQHYIVGAAGGGAALRAYALVKGVAAASLYGIEATAEVMTTTSSSVDAGVAAAVRGVMTVGLSTTGTVSCANLAMNIATGKTVHANSAFINVANIGAASCYNLFKIDDAIGSETASAIVSTGDDATATHYVKIMAGTTAMWLLATTTTPNVA